MTVHIRPLSELVPVALIELLGEQRIIDNIVGGIVEAARDHWIRLAQESLHRTRRDYLFGIQPVVHQKGMASVSLVGSWPNAIENGMPPFDMRSTLLGPQVPTVPPGQRGKHAIWKKKGRGATARMVEAGFYRHIPFRHMAPGSDATMTGQRMGRALDAHMPAREARKLGQMVYEKAQELKPYQTVYGGHPGPAPSQAQAGYGVVVDQPYPEDVTRAPRRLHFTEAEIPDETTRDLLTKFYGGMVREEKQYESAVQSQFVTFRTISTRAKEGWQHPGMPGQRLAARVSAHVVRIAEQSFENYAKGSKG